MAIIEITTFRLVDPAQPAGFVRADHDLQTRVYNPLPGFIRRTTARGADDEWVVVTLWQTAAHAAAVDPKHPAATHFASLIEAETLTTQRYATLD